MLKGLLFLSLIYQCQGYMNPRLRNWLEDSRQSRFLPAAAGAGVGSGSGAPRCGPGPASQPRRQAQDGRQPPNNPNYDNTYFCPMPEMSQTKATLVQDDGRAYPWVARVIHTRWDGGLQPMICTAAMIRYRTFITAARCIATAKPYYTKLLMRSVIQLQALTFVTPSVPTKQLFDDIGIIVTFGATGDVNGTLQQAPNGGYLVMAQDLRTAERYWFQDWVAGATYKVIGFIAPEDSPSTQNLYELDKMYGNNFLCNQILPMVDNSKDYWAACVHSCDAEQHTRNDTTCHRYLFGLGHVVLDSNDQLVGIVTWTCGNKGRDREGRGGLPLPVGVAVPDARLNLNLDCADLLRIGTRDVSLQQEIIPGLLEMCNE
ncbi:uncharacterized protein LOC134804361 [Cydia splendana]|uniref:uncharacterized protein LOC134804361 n=1 Tax=Cydia splendana TaxID=1100963 RepID=UPI0028F49FA7